MYGYFFPYWTWIPEWLYTVYPLLREPIAKAEPMVSVAETPKSAQSKGLRS